MWACLSPRLGAVLILQLSYMINFYINVVLKKYDYNCSKNPLKTDERNPINKTTYRELVEDYLQNEYAGTKPQQQRSRLNHWLNQFGDKKVAKITKIDINQGLFF
jgi:hypothetical protein